MGKYIQEAAAGLARRVETHRKVIAEKETELAEINNNLLVLMNTLKDAHQVDNDMQQEIALYAENATLKPIVAVLAEQLSMRQSSIERRDLLVEIQSTNIIIATASHKLVEMKTILTKNESALREAGWDI